MEKQSKEITLKDLVSLFVPKIWLIVLVGVIFAGATFGYFKYMKNDSYTAETTIIVSSGRSSISSVDILMSQQAIVDYSDIIVRRNFLSRVCEALHEDPILLTDVTVAQLTSMVTTSVKTDSMMIDISVTSADKEVAYYAAKVISELAPSELREIAPYDTNIKVVEDPLPLDNFNADSKHTLRNSAIGFILGAILAMGVIFLTHSLDVIIRGKEQFEQNFDVPVLGMIPGVHFEAVQKEEKAQ